MHFWQIKFLLIFLYLIANHNNSFAQKCNYEKNEIDGLLEVPIKLTGPYKLCRLENQPIYFKAQCIGDNKYIKIRYYNYDSFTLQKDREIGFVLPSEDELILFPRLAPVDSTKMVDYLDITTTVVYKLSNEQYEILKDVPIIKFKYYITSGFMEKDIKPVNQTKLMEALRCVE